MTNKKSIKTMASNDKDVTKNDKAWRSLFYDMKIMERINEEGYYRITAKTIKMYREPRLMAKIDQEVNLPRVFKENKLGILPISRGEYIISDFLMFEKIDKNLTDLKRNEVVEKAFPEFIESIDKDNITSEAVALNCAHLSGILNDFAGEQVYQTIDGRMGTEEFNFHIEHSMGDASIVDVKNAQIELDGGYEGLDSFLLVEAKNNMFDDFVVRQLYYPFRHMQSKLNKTVRPIFMIFSNDLFYLFEYRFIEPQSYSSLSLVKSKIYSLEDTYIEVDNLKTILRTVKVIEEPAIPFPQANAFERVINFCELVYKNPLDKESLFEKFDIDVRQIDYYYNAGKYLDLLELDKSNRVRLTGVGNTILGSNYKKRQLGFISQISKHAIFNEVLSETLKNGEILESNIVVDIMKKHGVYKVKSDETYFRRSSTVNSWVKWVMSIID